MSITLAMACGLSACTPGVSGEPQQEQAAAEVEPVVDQPVDQELLDKFMAELIAIKPGAAPYPAVAKLLEEASQTLDDPSPRAIPMPREFRIAKYEVTQELWEAVMGQNPSAWTGPRNSVEMLSFPEAVEFCRKLTGELRRTKLIKPTELVRLPTEVECEYVTRAGTNTRYSFGDNEEELTKYGWYDGNAAGNDPPVGALQPNPWGLYDVHGYLNEWCLSDPEHPYRYVSPTTSRWWELADDEEAVVRGGSWKDPAGWLASGGRRLAHLDMRNSALGLRCVVIDTQATREGKPVAGFTPTAPGKFFRETAALDLLWRGGEFTEGPAVADDGTIYFSDIGKRILQFDPVRKRAKVVREPSGRANGLVFDDEGRLLACEGANTGGGRRIAIQDADGTWQMLAERFNGKRFNSPNDLALHPDGSIYFTDPRYVGDEPRELDVEGVFRVTRDGSVTLATDRLSKPNGIVISRDGQRAFVAEHDPQGTKQLVAFKIGSDGSFGEPEILFDFGESRGIDGMAQDRAGHLFATAGSGEQAGIYVFSPLGEPLDFLPLPGDPTNCCSATSGQQHVLYITAAVPATDDQPASYGLYRIRVALPTDEAGM